MFRYVMFLIKELISKGYIVEPFMAQNCMDDKTSELNMYHGTIPKPTLEHAPASTTSELHRVTKINLFSYSSIYLFSRQ